MKKKLIIKYLHRVCCVSVCVQRRSSLNSFWTNATGRIFYKYLVLFFEFANAKWCLVEEKKSLCFNWSYFRIFFPMKKTPPLTPCQCEYTGHRNYVTCKPNRNNKMFCKIRAYERLNIESFYCFSFRFTAVRVHCLQFPDLFFGVVLCTCNLI